MSGNQKRKFISTLQAEFNPKSGTKSSEMSGTKSKVESGAGSNPPASKPAIRHPNTKRTGELAEAAFLVKTAGLGYAASKPWGDSERYDFILDTGNRTWACPDKMHSVTKCPRIPGPIHLHRSQKERTLHRSRHRRLSGLHTPVRSLVHNPSPGLPRKRKPPLLSRRQHQRTPSPLRTIP